MFLSKYQDAAISQHLDKTNQSNCSTVNQNSDSVKTFRDKKTPTVNPVSDIVNHISLTVLKVSTKIREGQDMDVWELWAQKKE